MSEESTLPATPPVTASPSAPASPHWSESFVEHLRTVHFALSVLAVAIIFTLMSGKAYDAQKARTQASEILNLSENWEKNMARLFGMLPAVEKNELPANEQFLIIKNKQRHEYFVRKMKPEPLSDFEEAIYFVVSKANMMSEYHWVDFSGPDKRPTTVASFELWWNKLHQGVRIPIADLGGLGTPSEACRRVRVGGLGVRARSRPKAADSQDCILEMEVGESPPANSVLDYLRCDNFFERDYKVSEVADCLFEGHRLDAHQSRFGVEILGNYSHIDESIMKKFYGDWGSEDFKTAFSDLSQATSQNLEYVDLKSLLDRLNEGSKGDQVIETFGLKIAANDVTRWGLLILLAAQFYFWLHLHELTRRIEPADPGWKVAWIGIYRPGLALITVVVSACLLPLVAASLAGYRLHFEGHLYWQRSIAALAVAVSAYLASSTGFKLYKLRSVALGPPWVQPAEPTEPEIRGTPNSASTTEPHSSNTGIVPRVL